MIQAFKSLAEFNVEVETSASTRNPMRTTFEKSNERLKAKAMIEMVIGSKCLANFLGLNLFGTMFGKTRFTMGYVRVCVKS